MRHVLQEGHECPDQLLTQGTCQVTRYLRFGVPWLSGDLRQVSAIDA